MGKLENEVKKEIRKTKIHSAIIGAIATAGILGLAITAPNAVGVLLGNKYFKQRKYQFKSSLSRLISAGYVKIATDKGRKFIRLTKKGEKYASLIGKGKLAIKMPKRWDKKWRILIFDIPEYRKPIREKVRRTLKSLGFFRLQKSVWIYPYDCEDLMTLIKADFKIGKDVLYIIADRIEYDKPLKSFFGLK